ncbi:cupin domain-containing protein [Pectobacteriaceae bacterium CE70]|nr:cupin domain-containing protein [Pectobacteriaceae bacterium CE70]WJY09018.1 cupin domain-containing protein [Pectobacteriaceae bacterium C80]
MTTNLLTNFPEAALGREAETFEVLLTRPDIRIERIISTGQSSPPGFWYCQPQSEWVTVLQGSARLQFENESDARVMKTGDFVNIPALCRHRVEWTDPKEPTIWLAVHYSVDAPPNEAGEA